MLADASPSLQGVAQGVVAKPNAGADALVNALTDRNLSRNTRLAADVDTNLGTAVPPSQVSDTIQSAQQALQPDYTAALQSASPVNTQGLANSLDQMSAGLRGDPQKAAIQVRKMLDAPSPVDPRFPNLQGLDSSPSTLLSTRQAIDGMIATEADPSVIRVLSNARQQVDQALTTAVPGIKAVDGQYAELARQQDALTAGSHVLDAGKTAMWPQELQTMQSQMSPAAQSALQTGVRADIANKVGTQSNDLAALKKALGGDLDWNRDKMGAIFGTVPRDNVVNSINREQHFADTFADIVRNSKTANRLGGSQLLDQHSGDIHPNLTWEGVAAKGAQTLYRMLTSSHNLNSRAELGSILSAQGPSRDALVKAILDSSQNQMTSNSRVRHLATALMAPVEANTQ